MLISVHGGDMRLLITGAIPHQKPSGNTLKIFGVAGGMGLIKMVFSLKPYVFSKAQSNRVCKNTHMNTVVFKATDVLSMSLAKFVL